MRHWTIYDLVFFDCDSTLSTIEGIDELARLKGKQQRVGLLTDKAMNGELDLAEVYGKRLKAIRPTRGQLKAIEEQYWENIVEDADVVIQALQQVQKHVFIISGGLIDAVKGFGRRLGVSPADIRAVELEYNQLSGDWWKYNEPSTQHNQTYLDYNEGPLTVTSGKPNIIKELAGTLEGRRIMVGDGSSDLATRDVVDLFVGYGGVVARENVLEEAEIFIHSQSIAPILPIVIGSGGVKLLQGTPYQSVVEKGIQLTLDGQVTFKQQHLQDVFKEVFSA